MEKQKETVTVAQACAQKLWEQPGVVLWDDMREVRNIVLAANGAILPQYWVTTEQPEEPGVCINTWLAADDEMLEVRRAASVYVPRFAAGGYFRPVHGGVALDDFVMGEPPIFSADQVARDAQVARLYQELKDSSWVPWLDEEERPEGSRYWLVIAWAALILAAALLAGIFVAVLVTAVRQGA